MSDSIPEQGPGCTHGSGVPGAEAAEIVSVSRHALERYRRHYPGALPADVHAALRISIPLSHRLVDAVLGRRERRQLRPGERHLLHPAGTGIFLLLPLEDDDARLYVRTYLRLDGTLQREMVRGWFLDPVKLLREAFELGFEAARAPGAPPLAVQASEAALEQLVELAPRLGAPTAETGGVPTAVHETVGEAEAGAGSVGAQEPPPPVPVPAWARSLAPDVPRVLRWFSTSHRGFDPDMARWRCLAPSARERILAETHVPGTDAWSVWLEPSAWCVAVVDVRGELRGLYNVPARLRAELLAGTCDGQGALPPPSDPPEHGPVASSGGEREGTWVAEQATICQIDDLDLRAWGPRARSEAEALGVGIFPVAYADACEAVEPKALEQSLPTVGWRLDGPGRYAALRTGRVLLLVREIPGAPGATIVRCAELAPPP